MFLGTLAAYAFSRFQVPFQGRPPVLHPFDPVHAAVVVAIPIFLMYRALGLFDTRLGMIILYTAVNMSLAVWLLNGFIDEIPREYEEAAMIEATPASRPL